MQVNDQAGNSPPDRHLRVALEELQAWGRGEREYGDVGMGMLNLAGQGTERWGH